MRTEIVEIFFVFILRMLAQLVSHFGGTPQVLSSTPRGSEFQAEGKKIPSLAPCAKALVVSRVNETGGNRSGLTSLPPGLTSLPVGMTGLGIFIFLNSNLNFELGPV